MADYSLSPASWLQVKNRALDTVSVKDFGAVGDGVTDDTAAIQNAINSAVTNGTSMLWPGSTFLTSSSIQDIHSVKHIGNGIIKRGAELFHVDIKSDQSNYIHVSPTGSDSNDGLSSLEPVETIQRGLDVLGEYGPFLDGTWKVKLSAGTYLEVGASIPNGLGSRNRIVVCGPTAGHPNIPTAIIDGTGGAVYTHALTANTGNYATFQDIKAINFGSDNSTGGFLGQSGADLYVLNCHVDGAGWFGCYITNSSIGRVSGGIFTNCREGVSFNASSGTVGYGASSLATGTQLVNCTESGVLWSRGSQGHCDYVTFDGNTTGLTVDRASRVNDVLCEYKSNDTGIRTRTGGIITADQDSEYHIGDAEANTVLFDFGAFSGPQDDVLERTGLGFTLDAHSDVMINRNLQELIHTGDTIATTVVTPYTLQAGYFIDGGSNTNTPRKLRFKISGDRVSNGGNPSTCSIGISFGSTEMIELSYYGTTPGDWEAEVEIFAYGPVSQRVRGSLTQGTGGALSGRRFGLFGRNVDMSANVDVNVFIKNYDAGDTMKIASVETFLTL